MRGSNETDERLLLRKRKWQTKSGKTSMRILFCSINVMIERLTTEQESLMKTVRDERIDRFFACHPVDKEKCKKHIEFMYRLSGLKTPNVVFLDSPY